MTLDEALEAVNERSQAALAGSGRTTRAGGEVPNDAAAMLLSGVAADPTEVFDALSAAAGSVIACIAGGDDPMSTIAGALLETFVLGALVGESA
jgi:hypothetical protein